MVGVVIVFRKEIELRNYPKYFEIGAKKLKIEKKEN